MRGWGWGVELDILFLELRKALRLGICRHILL